MCLAVSGPLVVPFQFPLRLLRFAAETFSIPLNLVKLNAIDEFKFEFIYVQTDDTEVSLRLSLGHNLTMLFLFLKAVISVSPLGVI